MDAQLGAQLQLRVALLLDVVEKFETIAKLLWLFPAICWQSR
jgi:hypothetical protein